MATTIDGVLIFLSLVFLYTVCVFLLRNLEKLTLKLKTQYPDIWIALGSVRFFGNTANSPEGQWYAWINYRSLYKFITFQHKKLSDKEVENLVSGIKKNVLSLVVGLAVLMFGIRYL